MQIIDRMYLKMLQNILFIFIVYLSLVFCENKIIVKTPVGEIQGSVMVTILGNEFYAFRGIPYAEPPIGELRYRPPIPAAKFDEVFDAQNEGMPCYRYNEYWSGGEDCLRVNVYTKHIPKKSGYYKKAVLMYIHGGAFHGQSGGSNYAGPHYLLDRDNIVFVSINYRLGSFGFLSTGDKEAPGNNGLKDQVLALKWVKKNIASFGGDPDNVTLFGYSAGAISVIYHLLSPMSKGLFHKAIAMSGMWNPVNNDFPYAERQAVRAGCPTNSSKDMLACLRQINPMEIIKKYEDMFEYIGELPIITWGPVIEKDFGQERFLTDDPEKLIREADLSNIPIMIGMSEYEYVYPAYATIKNIFLAAELNYEWDKKVPMFFNYERNTSRSHLISNKLKEFYLNSRDLTNDDESLQRLRSLFTDGMMGFPIHRCVDLLAENGKNQLYYYLFTYLGRHSFVDFYANRKELNIPMGPSHGDEMLYIFSIEKYMTDVFTPRDQEYPMILKMTKLLTNFANYGNPTPISDTKFNNVRWPPFDKQTKLYIDISETMKINKCLSCDRLKIWDELFPIIN